MPNTFTHNSSRQACSICPRGRTAPKGAASCSACVAGEKKVAMAVGDSDDVGDHFMCEICLHGKIAQEGDTSCTLCDEGTYQSEHGKDSCVSCPSGRYNEMQGMTFYVNCTACPMGYSGPKLGATECSECNSGRYQSKSSSSFCLPCVPGFMAPTPTQQTCSACPLGLYTDEVAKDVCKECITGKYSNTSGASVCLDCLPGKYNPTKGMALCTKCPLGFYTENEAQNVCAKCDVGQYNNKKGFSLCFDCLPGFFNADTNASTCTKCDASRYAKDPKSTECSEPETGTVVGIGGSSSVKIADGFFATGNPNEPVMQCARGRYGTIPPSTLCQSCPIGWTSTSGALNCHTCEKGKFAVNTLGAPNCSSCDINQGQYSDEEAATTCKKCKGSEISTGKRCIPAPLDKNLPVLRDVRVAIAVIETDDLPVPVNHSYANISWSAFTDDDRQSEVTNIMLEWSNDLEFLPDRSDAVVITTKDATLRTEHGSHLIDLLQFPPLISKVLYVRLRTLSQGGAVAGEWSIPSGKWQVTTDCLQTQYLDTFIVTNRSWDPTTFKCRPCPEGASCEGDITWSGVIAKFGYWRIVPSSVLPNEFAECPFPGACLGAKNPKLEGTYFNKSWENGQWVEFEFDYAQHRLNEECNAYYGFKRGSRLCHTCKDDFRRRGLDRCAKCPTVGQNFGLLILAVLLLVAGGVVVVWMTIVDAGVAADSEIIRKITFNFLQVSALAAGFPLHWPPALEALFDFQGAISTAGEHILNPDCSVRGVSAADLFFAKQIGYAFTPICLTLVIFVYWRVYALCRGVSWSDRLTVKTHTTKDKMIVTICVLLYFFWPTSLKQAFSVFSCRTVGSTSDALYLVAE